MKSNVISIIVTTRNEERNIRRCLQSIIKQNYKKFEIIVVDNHSTDATQKIAKVFTNKVFTYGPERSAQRNYGASKAIGEYIFFIDADMELKNDVLASIILYINEVKKFGGAIIPEQSVGVSFWERVKVFERSFYLAYGDSTTDAARVFPLYLFNKNKGYDESITGPEDWDLPERIKKNGYSIIRVPTIIFHYENIPSLKQLLKKKYYYALKSHRYLKKHNISTFSSKTIYFLRPVFYKQWKAFFRHPILSTGLFIMLSGELFAGGLGFFKGKIQNL